MTSILQIPIQPGFVSAILFILFDPVVLSLLDTSFTAILSRVYFDIIFRKGVRFIVRTVEIPSITSNVMGDSIISPRINIVVLVVKLVTLAVIFFVDFSLDGLVVPRFETRSYSSSFGFDVSDSAWPYDGGTPVRLVERRWAKSRRCLYLNSNDGDGDDKMDGERLQFYPLVFNLTTNLTTGTEVVVNNESIVLQSIQEALFVDFIALNDSSVQCTSPTLTLAPNQDVISNSSTKTAMPPLVNVTGCSDYPQQNLSQCFPISKRNISINLPFGGVQSKYFVNLQTLLEGDGLIMFQVFRFPSSVWSSSFPPSYSPALAESTLTCTRSRFGLFLTHTSMRTSCMFYVPSFADDNRTLLEVWRYDGIKNDNGTSSYMTRTYAGPVFEGILPFGRFQTLNLLVKAARMADFATFASIVVAEATVYTRFESPLRVAVRNGNSTFTLVPWFAVGIAAGLAAATAVFALVVRVTGAGDERPQFSTIDGLSSIAREERHPTGACLVKGDPCSLAITGVEGDGKPKLGVL